MDLRAPVSESACESGGECASSRETRDPAIEHFKECIYFASDGGHLHATTTPLLQIPAPISASIYLSTERIAHVVGIGNMRHTQYAGVVRAVGHSVNTSARNLLAAHVNPTHRQFRRLQTLGDSAVLSLEREHYSSLEATIAAACRGQLSLVEAADLFDAVVELTVRQLPASRSATSCCSELLAREQAQSGSPLREFADELGVCYERASRVFKDVTGTTLRSYRLWLRLHEVRRALSSGKSLTDIAHELGFTDLSHMTRIHSRCFGYPPSRILRDDVLIVGPDDRLETYRN